ncbi:HMG box-containing protein [Histoplasma capsulatum G186AR]|uniref:HMG box-containing protein n=1 Tax=Ajellomyces capsulatus TaxID=5037 RepID=A0A8H7Z863_AJECA|nr:HMG box-containing protein [Histoplasma capsulatum]QSS69149.1 HMG box-containing protein [Histoplasma capsulatum G186AR]
MIPSLPKKFDLKPLSSMPASKRGSSPKRNRVVNHKASEDKMEGPQPDSQPSSLSRSGGPEQTVSIVTPPSSPSKPRLYSPSKSKSRIPPTPHRPSIDAFWSQEIINEWNDQYSPRKMNTPRRGLERFRIYSDDEDDDINDVPGRSHRNSISPQSSPSKSPIKSSPSKKASAAAAAAAKKALAAKKKEFDEKKVKMAEEFFKTLDDATTGGQIQKLAAAAGGVKIIWSKTLNTTAGRANWKRETVRQKPSPLPAQQQVGNQSQLKQQATSSSLLSASGSHENNTSMASSGSKLMPTDISTGTSKSNNTGMIPLTPSILAPVRHHASIELASKVIDSEDRLLNTLAHEYCHLANFMISNVRNNPHGTSFKQWAAKCEKALAAHPVYGCSSSGENATKARINITTKHSYVIHYKYLWCCAECGNEYGRHSRSIDVQKSRCGRCKVGALVQVRPKPRGGRSKKAGATVAAVEGVTKSMGGVHLNMW